MNFMVVSFRWVCEKMEDEKWEWNACGMPTDTYDENFCFRRQKLRPQLFELFSTCTLALNYQQFGPNFVG